MFFDKECWGREMYGLVVGWVKGILGFVGFYVIVLGFLWIVEWILEVNI